MPVLFWVPFVMAVVLYVLYAKSCVAVTERLPFVRESAWDAVSKRSAEMTSGCPDYSVK